MLKQFKSRASGSTRVKAVGQVMLPVIVKWVHIEQALKRELVFLKHNCDILRSVTTRGANGRKQSRRESECKWTANS